MKNLSLNKLQELALVKRLPHAWLFICHNNALATKAAHDFSRWLLCTNKQNHAACDLCKSCSLLAANSHPDLCVLTTKNDKATIAIDDVRAVTEFSNNRPQMSTFKVVIVSPAQALHKQSANSLLKTLEEPRGNTIFLLVANHVDLLPKTIVSRCHILNIPALLIINEENKVVIQQVVQDLCALWVANTTTCSKIVEQWIKKWPQEVLYWLEIVLTDIIRFKYTGNSLQSNAWFSEQEDLSKALSTNKFWTILERLRQAQYWFGQKHNPNLQLMLEHILLV